MSTTAKKPVSKFFRVAVEGATSDGRVIDRAMLEQIAASYDPKVYGARINVEHIRGLSPSSEFRAYGDVLAVKTEEVEIGGVKKLALFAQISPTDELVGIDNATRIFVTAKHPKSFVSLSGADHLVSKKSDAVYVANVIVAWAERYFDLPETMSEAEIEVGTVLVRETGEGKFQQEILSGPHRFLADEPVKVGGMDSGPGPYDLLLAGLGACTAMTLRLYAEQKKLPLKRVSVRLAHNKIHAQDCAHCETAEGLIDHIDRAITLEGDLDAAQRRRLLEIADKCPVHRTLTSEIDIRTVERPA